MSAWQCESMLYVHTDLLRNTGFNPRSCHTKDFKMVLDASLLYTQLYKVGIKGKVEQSWERSSTLPKTLL